LTEKQKIELDRERALKELEILKQEKLSTVESSKFGKTVEAIGKETLVEIANAGPEL